MKFKLSSSAVPSSKLLEMIRSGNEEALKYLYKKNYPRIRSYILKNNGTEQDAKDLFQDALIVIWKKAQDIGFNLSSDIGTYLYSIVKHNWLKKLKRVHNTTEIDNEIHEIVDSYNREEALFKDFQVESLLAAMEKLSDICKVILGRFYYENWSMDRIAVAIGFSNADAVKTKKYKCMQILRSLMKHKS